MNAQEERLLAISKVPANAGHTLHRGTPRETFIREFLQGHLPQTIAIGTGEIIDSNSKPRGSRNQFDIVLFKRQFPKLDFGGSVDGFLIESVTATIEVKSILDQAGIEQAIGAARNAKALTPSQTTAFSAGYMPPKVLNYVVAYDGPASMETVAKWILTVHERQGIPNADLPLDERRLQIASPSVDGVFVLGKGFLYFDNVPYGFMTPESRQQQPSLKWVYADTPEGNLLILFLFLQTACANMDGRWLNPLPYLASFNVDAQALRGAG